MKIKRITAIVLILILSVSLVYAENAPMTEDGEMAKTLITQAANYIIQKYKFDVERDDLYRETLMKLLENHPELTEYAFEAMYSSLDEHTQYFSQDELDLFLNDMSGEFYGIGVVITKYDEGLYITDVQPDSSAMECGMKKR